MRHLSTPYRIGLLGLIALMVIFTAGLPIVVASCPMMRSGAERGPCCSAPSPLGSVQLRGVMNSSCCKTTLAAERNTTDYLQVSIFTGFIPQPATIGMVHETLASCAGRLAIEHSPPPADLHGDIPVFLSTLII